MSQERDFTPQERLFDPIRKRWVARSPEECVRQHTLQWMLEHGGYRAENLLVERSLPLGVFDFHSTRRLDIAYFEPTSLCSQNSLLLLIECKASLSGSRELEKAKRQVLGYHWELPSLAIALVSDQKAWYCLSQAPELWLEGLPTLGTLKQFQSAS